MTVLQRARRVVVKVGSSLVTNDGRGLDAEAIARWARQIAELRSQGKQIVLVSSGAIAEGMQRLGWTQDGALSLSDTSSKWLGKGWTSTSAANEGRITIRTI